MGPRGRVTLVKGAAQGSVKWSRAVEERTNRCLGCLACTANCPAGVEVAQAATRARSVLVDRRLHFPWRPLVLRGLVSHPRRLEASLWALRASDTFGLRERLRRWRILERLPGHWWKLERMMPPVPTRPLHKALPEHVPARGPWRLRVAYFHGCVHNLLTPHVGQDTVALLSDAGCEVVIPRGQRCCGMPLRAYGDWEGGRKLVAHNVRTLAHAQVDAVVTDCATCGSVLKEFGMILGGSAEEDKAKEVSNKVVDVTVLLGSLGWRPNQALPKPVKVTYHDPCHLVRGQGVRREPRELLASLPGAELVELNEADWCCGGAGSYNLSHFSLSMRILDRKMASIAETGATVVASGCPACQMQLTLGAARAGLLLEVFNPVQLAARTLPRL